MTSCFLFLFDGRLALTRPNRRPQLGASMTVPHELTTDDLITGYLVAEESQISSSTAPSQLGERIASKNVSLLGFVKMLGPALVADSAEKRARGASLWLTIMNL